MTNRHISDLFQDRQKRAVEMVVASHLKTVGLPSWTANADGLNKLPLTMYNRNYGGFDRWRIHSELLNALLNRKIVT